MHIFRRPHYESEITQFIQQLKVKKPNLESRPLAGRPLLWDKNWTAVPGPNTVRPRCRKNPTST